MDHIVAGDAVDDRVVDADEDGPWEAVDEFGGRARAVFFKEIRRDAVEFGGADAGPQGAAGGGEGQAHDAADAFEGFEVLGGFDRHIVYPFAMYQIYAKGGLLGI